jgi:branched-subunit amino acid aminotransferase/4-amino-4-deoxychorismate lyase
MSQAAFNGQIVSTDALRISALSDGFMYGHGLFETIKVVDSRLVFFEDHFVRISRSAVALSLAFDGSSERLRAICEKVIATNALIAGNLKVILFQDETRPGEIVLARSGLYPKETYERGFGLTIEKAAARSALAAHKTLNYFENIAAKRRAVANGFDEPIFVDAADSLLEGATTNIFVVKGGQVFTPPTDGRILPGVVRGRIAKLLGIRLVEASVALTQLRDADEVFVTNALLGVMPVTKVDEKTYDLTKNPVTRELMEAVAR